MQSTVTRMLKELMQNGAMALGLLGWLFYLKWKWAIIAIIIFPLMAIPVSNISRKLKKFSHIPDGPGYHSRVMHLLVGCRRAGSPASYESQPPICLVGRVVERAGNIFVVPIRKT